MNELQETIIKPAIPPAAILDNAAASSLVIDKNDLRGARYAEFAVNIGSIDAAMSVLRVMESDVKTNATTLGGSPTLVKDTASKPGADDDNKTLVIGVDLSKSRKRYLQLQATAGDGATGTFIAATCIAYRPQTASSLAADRGLLSADYA